MKKAYIERFLCLSLMLILLPCSDALASGRLVTPGDCVRIKYLVQDGLNAVYGSIKLNPQGTKLLYLVKSPDISTNTNTILVYVREVNSTLSDNGKVITSGQDVSEPHWLEDGTHFTALVRRGRWVSLVMFDADSASEETIAKTDRNIIEYSVSRDARIAVFTLGEPPDSVTEHTREERASGYRVPFGQVDRESHASPVAIVRRRGEKWSLPRPIRIRDPFGQTTLPGATQFRFLSVSPDGRKVLMQYPSVSIPASWKASPYIRSILGWGGMPSITVLVDLATGKTTIPFAGVTDSLAFWSEDGRSFLVAAHSPVGSHWEQQDVREHRLTNADANLFWVSVDDGKIEEVFFHVAYHHQTALAWRLDGRVVVQVGPRTVAVLERQSDGWQEVSRTDVPLAGSYGYSAIVSDGKTIVGIYQSPTVSPDLYAFSPGQGAIRLLTKLNPQLDHLSLSEPELIHWKTSNGATVDGLFFKPVGYVAGRRYPLVIQTKGDVGSFVCDSGVNHDPAFAPQPLASAGIAYLFRRYPENYRQEDEIAQYPKTVPGELGEALYEMDVWETAVDSLDRSGLIDPTRVGIIGFSRTGWEVEFDLAHSRIRFAAATASDNIQYSLGEYALLHQESTLRAYDEMYGGPPYGSSLANWLKYSVSFNMDKIHTPLMIESMGYGIDDNTPGKIPLSIATRDEIFVGLSHLDKPVELYYYPNEEHSPDHPRARLASLQRSLDWYRFWLQGYERPNAEDKDQYRRWEKLRTLQNK